MTTKAQLQTQIDSVAEKLRLARQRDADDMDLNALLTVVTERLETFDSDLINLRDELDAAEGQYDDLRFGLSNVNRDIINVVYPD